jgi:predicted component of type VI protein secretion system
MPRLILLMENCEPYVYPLGKATLMVGRNDASDLHLPDAAVSNNHASIVLDGKQFLLRDNGSTNGSFVNGEPVSRRILAHYDIIKFGLYRFLVDLKDEIPLPTNIPERQTTDIAPAFKNRSVYPLPETPDLDAQSTSTKKAFQKVGPLSSNPKIILTKPVPISKVATKPNKKGPSGLGDGRIWGLLK